MPVPHCTVRANAIQEFVSLAIPDMRTLTPGNYDWDRTVVLAIVGLLKADAFLAGNGTRAAETH